MPEVPIELPDDQRFSSVELVVRVGDTIRPGDRIGTITTDKAELELEASESGRVEAIRKTPRGYVLTLSPLPEAR
jgi:biotin carboxyl carrier protein